MQCPSAAAVYQADIAKKDKIIDFKVTAKHILLVTKSGQISYSPISEKTPLPVFRQIFELGSRTSQVIIKIVEKAEAAGNSDCIRSDEAWLFTRQGKIVRVRLGEDDSAVHDSGLSCMTASIRRIRNILHMAIYDRAKSIVHIFQVTDGTSVSCLLGALTFNVSGLNRAAADQFCAGSRRQRYASDGPKSCTSRVAGRRNVRAHRYYRFRMDLPLQPGRRTASAQYSLRYARNEFAAHIGQTWPFLGWQKGRTHRVCGQNLE